MRKLFYILSFILLFLSCEKKEKTSKPILFSNATIENSKNLDSINEALEVALAVADFDRAYIAQRRKYEILHREVSAHRYKAMLDSLATFAENSGSKKLIAESTYKYGRYYRLQEKYDSAYFYYNKAKDQYLNLSDSLEIAKAYFSLGKILYKENDYFTAQQLTIEGLNYLPPNTKAVYLISSYNVLGYSAMGLEKYEQATYWYEQAIAVAPKSKYAQQVKINLAKIYIYQEKYKKAINLLNTLLRSEEFQEENISRVRILTFLGNAYTKIGNRKKALPALQEALRLRKKLDTNLGYVYEYLARFYRDSNPEKAKEYIDKILDSSDNLSLRLGGLKLMHSLPQIANKDKYYEKYIHLLDSLHKINISKADKYAQIRYRGEQSKKRILQLEKETTKKELQIERQKYTNLIVGFIIFLLVVLTIGFYIVMFNRHKKNKEIAVYDTENKLSKRVHDEVANEVYQLINTLEHKEKLSKQQVLDRLEIIYEQTRNIARQNSSLEILEDFSENLSNLIYSYQNQNASIIVKNLEEKTFKNFEPKNKITLYRIVQELMTNMKKHSKADLVFLNFEAKKDKINFVYRDNGKGYENDGSIIENGLKNVKDRVKENGGKIKIINLFSGGVEIKISLLKKK